MRAPRLFLFWGFLTGVAAGLASAAPPSSIVEPVGEAREKASFTFQVTTPTPLLSNLPDGSTQVRVEGLAGRGVRPGLPDLPFSVVRVAIPPGATPRILLDKVVEAKMPNVSPRPVAKLSASLRPEAGVPEGPGDEERVRRVEERSPDPIVFAGREVFPESIARLGKIETFRDQRYVEVVIAPVRFDPTISGLRVARSFQVTIAFDGDTGARTVAPPDPRIDDLYRDMFVNYGQGTSFRLTAAPTALAFARAPSSPQAGPRYRIRVRANGVVRLDFATLNGTGFESLPLSTYKLTDRGAEVPILVFDANSNDQLDAGDWVQFYGQAVDDEPKTTLNTFIAPESSIYELSDYTDENVYFLTAEAGARSRLPERSAPASVSAPATKFDAVAHVEVDNAFRPLAGNDPWYWSPALANPPASGSPASRPLSIPLPGLASGTDPARVLVRLRGLTEDPATPSDHKSRVTFLNSLSQPLAINNDDGTFDGRAIYTHDFSWSFPGTGAVLTNPAQVTIDALVVAGSSGYVDSFIPDFVEVQYKRNFQASGDALTFDVPDGDAEFQVTGLTTSAPEVWEITGHVGSGPVAAPVRVTGGTIGGGAGNYSVRFHMSQDPALPDGTPRRFVVTGPGAVAIPAAADFTPDTVSDLRNTSNQADLIVIAHPTPLGATATTTLNALLAWKLANQGITSKVAMIQDVYDEFGDGLATPQAIKNFLAFVMSTNPGEGWSGRKPAWVLLVGDGSFDSKYNDTSKPPSNFVPTEILFKDDPAFGYYASDSMLADVVGGDAIPDLVVGRISTRNDAQTESVLHKLLDYEQNPPAGDWRKRALFVSDRGKFYDIPEAQDFEDTNALARSWLKLPPNMERTLRYWTDYCGGNAPGCTPAATEAMRADIKSAVSGTDGSDGASIMQYIGHGNFNVWSDEAFFAEGWSGLFDVSSPLTGLKNVNKLPWLIVHNCLTGGFEDTNDTTMGEAWLKKPTGGAMAVFAPSGLTDGYSGADITDKLWGTLFGRTKERTLGNAVAVAMNYICGLGVQQTCQNYVLLGDPSTRMVFTTVQPPSQVQATPGNAVVNLSWTASATSGARYDVYRAVGSATATYAKLNATSISVAAYPDTTVTNAKTYYYYVVALDPDGFESRWSNFNSDCAVSGPDCVTTTPSNPNPPAAPTGLSVADAETSGKLTLAWSANAEPDLDHYTVWWGTASGAYTFSAPAGKSTAFTLAGLANGTSYYIALTATNSSNRASSYSPEGTGTPTFVRGLRSPAFIGSLKVTKSLSGSDALLSWAPVTIDLYGKPATISYYEVFRGTTVGFVPGAGNKIGQTTTPSFIDPGALSFASASYYYLVRAVDGSGDVGGLGNQLPNGVDTLMVSKTPDGLGGFTLDITWPAVTTDFNGLPLSTAHYEIYGTSHPFTRADITNGLVPLVASPSTSSFSVTAPAASQYYAVLAVDARGNKSPF